MNQEERMRSVDKTIRELDITVTDDFLVGLILTLYSLEPMYEGGGFLITKNSVSFVLANGESFMKEDVVDGQSPRKAMLMLRRRLLIHTHNVLKGTADVPRS